MNTNIHANSVAAYHAEFPNLATQKGQILAIFHRYGAMTDREALARFAPGSDDMNRVRPKITSLVDDGYLREVGDTYDKTTDKWVRKCAPVSPREFETAPAAPDIEPCRPPAQPELFTTKTALTK